MSSEHPVGPEVDTAHARRPGPVVLEGARHPRETRSRPSWRARCGRPCRGDDSLWTYMGYGPFADEAAFLAWLERGRGQRSLMPMR